MRQNCQKLVLECSGVLDKTAMRTHASGKNPWLTTARGDPLDWSDIRDRIDLADVATALLGPAPGRRGERGRRRWWPCPFHEDKNPSFAVEPGKRWWKCYGCSEHGDAASLVMRLRGLTFPEAVRWLAEQAGIVMPSRGKLIRPRPPADKPGKAAARPPDPPSGLPLADALALVEHAAKRIWTPEGADALEYLRGRGLTDETISQARLGWTPGVSIPTKDGARFWTVKGIVIPWLDGDRLALVKIRRPEGSKPPRYVEAYRDRPGIYPGFTVVQPGRPLIVVEGELDALLLGQALGDLAAVLTLGPASVRPEGSTYLPMLAAPAWYLAHDADGAGDKAASGWPARAIRVRPPGPYKDWTEAAQARIALRRWWTDRLGGPRHRRCSVGMSYPPGAGECQPGTRNPASWYRVPGGDPCAAFLSAT
jgi:CHC2 zinc finger